MSSVYLCMDLSGRNQMLLSRWSLQQQQQPENNTTDHQQLSKSKNHSPLPSAMLGKTMAKMHCSDEHLNLMFRQWSSAKIESEFRRHHLENVIREKNNDDRTAALAKEYGSQVCSNIMSNIVENYRWSTGVNNNSSIFKRLSTGNINQKRISISQRAASVPILNNLRASIRGFDSPRDLRSSITTNKRSLRMTFAQRSSKRRSSVTKDTATSPGQIERDIGMAFSYPVACCIAYAIQGKEDSIEDCLQAIKSFWTSYAVQLTNKKKDDQFLSDSYRFGLGWCGWFLYVSCYRMVTYMDILPIEDLGHEDKEIVLDTIGYVALKLMHLGFSLRHDDYDDDDENVVDKSDVTEDYAVTLEYLSQQFEEILEDETTDLLDINFLNQRRSFKHLRLQRDVSGRNQLLRLARERSGWTIPVH